MKIGIISDTHKKFGRAKKIIDLFIENNCSYIIHAGDIVREEVLQYLEQSTIPYTAVLGNNDAHLSQYSKKYNLVKEPYFFSIKDIKIKLMHHPYYLAPEGSNIIVYGHSHTQICEQHNKTLFLNPGEACARDRGISQAMILKVKEKKYIIQQYQRKAKTNNWTVSSKKFHINGTPKD